MLLYFLPPKDPEGKPKKANIRDNQDGTYLVSYVPDMTGRYTILIKYGGDEIPYSPYRIRALPTGDASKCTVTGRPLTPLMPNRRRTSSHLLYCNKLGDGFNRAVRWVYRLV